MRFHLSELDWFSCLVPVNDSLTSSIFNWILFSIFPQESFRLGSIFVWLKILSTKIVRNGQEFQTKSNASYSQNVNFEFWSIYQSEQPSLGIFTVRGLCLMIMIVCLMINESSDSLSVNWTASIQETPGHLAKWVWNIFLFFTFYRSTKLEAEFRFIQTQIPTVIRMIHCCLNLGK